MLIKKFTEKVSSVNSEPIQAWELSVLQVNLGYRCNMACKHCHVSGGPMRTELMNPETAEQVLRVLSESAIETLDITGGAPEMNPVFRALVIGARKAGRRVIARTNLTIFFEEGMDDLSEFYRGQGVELIASLPYYLEDGVDRVRGSGTFKMSIEALKRLNGLGYGKESSDLQISLVYNPQAMFLAPSQCMLEAEYKRALRDQFGVSFNHLYTVTNMPIGRFRDFLVTTGTLDMYMKKLTDAFNPMALDGIMCRHMVSIGWDGKLYDCDFNQILGLSPSLDAPQHINNFDYRALARRKISMGDHCYGCTAGQGST